jgi:hypothetical protein
MCIFTFLNVGQEAMSVHVEKWSLEAVWIMGQ